MSKTFRAWKIDDPLLLPVSVQDFVAKDHLASFVLSAVRDELDLAKIMSCYSSGKGQPPFHPVTMTALLLYAYCRWIYSSRRIAKACRERVDFMRIVALDAPDFRTCGTPGSPLKPSGSRVTRVRSGRWRCCWTGGSPRALCIRCGCCLTLTLISRDQTISLWDPKSRAETSRLDHPSQVTAMAVLPDGRLASLGMYDGAIRLWDPKSGAETGRFNHPREVTDLAVLPDGPAWHRALWTTRPGCGT